jgi:hypothetical protein
MLAEHHASFEERFGSGVPELVQSSRLCAGPAHVGNVAERWPSPPGEGATKGGHAGFEVATPDGATARFQIRLERRCVELPASRLEEISVAASQDPILPSTSRSMKT